MRPWLHRFDSALKSFCLVACQASLEFLACPAVNGGSASVLTLQFLGSSHSPRQFHIPTKLNSASPSVAFCAHRFPEAAGTWHIFLSMRHEHRASCSWLSSRLGDLSRQQIQSPVCTQHNKLAHAPYHNLRTAVQQDTDWQRL